MADPNKPLDPRIYNPDGSLKNFKGQRGGPRPGAGRPPGSPNGPQAQFKALARKYTVPAMQELVRLAGFAPRIDPKTGEQMVDKDGNLVFLPGAISENARIQAINILLERGWGKPTQKLAGDETEAPIRTEQIHVQRQIVGAGNHTEKPPAPSNADDEQEAEDEQKRA